LYELDHLYYGYDGQTVVEDVSLNFEAGHFCGILGPNGSGKTTLLDLLSGHLRPHGGSIRLDGRELTSIHRKALARRIALVPQDYRINFSYTCGEVLMMGRYPHLPRFSRPTARDRAVVAEVIEQTGLGAFADRYVDRLSGGERQRVVFARGLAQAADILLLDEATASLDIQHAIALLNLAERRVGQGGTVIAVFQDINLAALYCDRWVCLRQGRLVCAGPTADVLTAATLQAVFDVQAQVVHQPFCGAPQVCLNKEVA
jgi:iron complex transport system ATP-binding protein